MTILIILSLSGCGLDPPSNQNLNEISSKSTNINKNIEFIAELSTPLQQDESLALDLVDEIKGIPNNIIRFNMAKIDDLHYHVIISVMVGSNVSYRYSKIGIIAQSEVTVTGNAVRYRLFHVGDTFQVKDIISAWTGNDYPGSGGNINGTIQEKGSGSPVGDVLICLAGYQTFSDSLGKFSISDIPEGTHNLVALAIDGSYKVFQQNIQIDLDLDTSVDIELKKLKEVSVKFIADSPKNMENVPVRIAGNLYQFGNTYVDLHNGINLLASRMPVMTALSNNRYSFEIKLHEGNDLHYVYTLGDGFWNSEQGLDDKKGYRQLIIPGDDITIYDTIENWRNESLQSVQFSLTIPENTPSEDIITIQFGSDSWFEPIPMVFAGNFQWNFHLFTPYPISGNLNYRFCRNYSCDLSASTAEIISNEKLSIPGSKTIEVQVSEWSSWSPETSPPTIYASTIPKKESDYFAGIELLPEGYPPYLEGYRELLEDLKNKGVNSIILQPSRSFIQPNNHSPINLSPSFDLLIHDVMEIYSMAEVLDMNLILSPVIESNSGQVFSNSSASSTSSDSNEKKKIQEFILSYAQLASDLPGENFIIDLSCFGYPDPDQSNSGINNEEMVYLEFPSLIKEVKSIFSGKVICSLPLSALGDIPSDSLGTCDALYYKLDFPLSQPATFDEAKYQIGAMLDEKLFPLQGENPNPIYIGFSVPSIAPEKSGELNLSVGEILTPQDVRSYSGNMDFEYQALIYNAFLNEIIHREWIKGVVARSIYPPPKITDASISIYGKPAMDVLWYWYTGIK